MQEVDHLVSQVKDRGAYQSSTSALPVKAWHMIITLSAVALSFPKVLYATGAFRSTRPHSSSNEGMIS
jgi:hypothetical protein